MFTMPAIRVMRRSCCAVLALGVLAGVPSHAQPPPGGVCDAAPQDAPLDFVLKDLNDNPVSLARYSGNVIVLNFWATWCTPCRIEVPRLIKLQDQFRAKGLTVVGLSMDTELQKVRDYAQRTGINYPILVIGTDHAIEKAYAPIWGVPSTVLIRRNGLICRRQMAFVSDRDFENRIRGLLRESK